MLYKYIECFFPNTSRHLSAILQMLFLILIKLMQCLHSTLELWVPAEKACMYI